MIVAPRARLRPAALSGACAAVLALSTALTVGSASGVPLPADPTDRDRLTAAQSRNRADLTATGKRSKELSRRLAAARIQLESVATKAALATERYNQAKALLAVRAKTAADAQQRADAARLSAQAARNALNRVAAQLYMQGGSLDGVEAFLSPSGPADLARRMDGAAAVTDYRDRTLRDAQAVLARADELQRQAAQAQLLQQAAAAQSESLFAAAQAEEASAARQAAALQAQQASLLAELATLRQTSVELEMRRVAADEMDQTQRALTEALRVSRRSTGTSKVTRASAAKAIAFAQAQLDEPYRWGGEGPDSWDCSGLTQGAWKAAGRSLTHYTGSQWQETQRVALADLQPGDLVFFGQAPAAIHHVGLYVGSGMMIEAPRTGLNVRYSPIWRSGLISHGGRP